MKKILIAVDYDSSAEIVSKGGYALAKALNAQAILLHVIAEPTYYSSLKYSPIFGFDNLSSVNLIQADTDGQLEAASLMYLEKLKQFLGDETIQTIVKNSDDGEAILDVARELEADMIVMGSHRRGGLEKILAGSLTEVVLRNAMVPVLVIPVKIDEDK